MTDPTHAAVAVDAQRLGRRFGYRTVFEDVSLRVGRGDVLLVMGPNGTGKTTLLRVLAGLLRPSSGTITRSGTVELVAHDAMVYDALTARENLRFFARLRGRRAMDRVDPTLNQVGLNSAGDQLVGSFSRGMRQRLAIGRALVNGPDLLLLDEPFTGLDSDGTRRVSQLIDGVASEGCAIVMVSHDAKHAVGLSTSVAFVVDRKLVGPEPIRGGADGVSARYAEVLGDG